VNAASQTKTKYDEVTKSLQQKAPEANELLKWFHQTALSYATFIPGAKAYVDKAFDDINKVEQKHRGEVNDIISKTYSSMQGASKGGLTLETAAKTWEILQEALKQLGELAANSAGDLLDNHPELKDKFGGNLDQLKDMASSYGPEAKKELDATYSQIKDILDGGVGVGSIAKIKGLIDEKIEKVKSMGDQAWKKGIEQAKPYLDSNPKVKELLEKNQDTLKSSNLAELWEKLKSNNADDIQSYVKQASEKAEKGGLSSFGSLGKEAEKYLKMIPGADEIMPKLMKLQDVAKNHGDEAEKLLKDTYAEIGEILKLASKAGEEVKKEGKEGKREEKDEKDSKK